MAEGEQGRDGSGGMATAPTVERDAEAERPPRWKGSAVTTAVGHPSLVPGGGQQTEVGRVVAAKYRLERELGAGGMGTVYEARHVDLPRRYALKLLRPDRAWDPLALERFRREAREASAIEHPGIVDVVDFGQTPEGEVYLVMELLEGEPLDALLRRGPPSIARAVDIVIEVLDALQAAHDRGLVHRDIKPDNLFSCRDGRTKILDFGIAKATRDDAQLTQAGIFIGTPSYMSLEQMEDSADVDVRADVYAVGATLFHLLTGAPPVTGGSVSAVMSKVIADEVRRDPREVRAGTPDWLASIVVRALSREASARFASAREMAEALRRGRAELPTLSAVVASDGNTVIEDLSTADTIDADSAASSRPMAEAQTARRSEPPPDAPSLTAAELDRRRQRDQIRWIAGGGLILSCVVAVYALWPSGPSSTLAPVASTEPEPGADATVSPIEMKVPEGMIRIEGGTFLMGSRAEEIERARAWCTSLSDDERLGSACGNLDRETPAHAVTLAPFAIDEREVDNRSFAAWLEEQDGLTIESGEGGQVVRDGDVTLVVIDGAVAGITRRDGHFVSAPRREHAAASYVTWFSARRYCRSRGKRLPTESEWERVARGTVGRVFAWGDERPSCADAVFARLEGAACAHLRPQAPMESHASPRDRTPEGVLAMAGNVREWTADSFVERYPSCEEPCADPGRDADVGEQATARVIRGGGWAQPAFLLRAARRAQDEPGWADPSVGFRCALDLSGEGDVVDESR